MPRVGDDLTLEPPLDEEETVFNAGDECEDESRDDFDEEECGAEYYERLQEAKEPF